MIAPRELRRAIRQTNVLGLPIEDGDLSKRERSDLEEDFLALCHRHRLPAPEVNVPIGGHLVDCLWREQMVVVETDGYIYHRVRLADSQIEQEPARIAAVLGARLARFPSSGRETRQAAP